MGADEPRGDTTEATTRVFSEIVKWLAQLPEGTYDVLQELREDEARRRDALSKAQLHLDEVQRKIAMIEDTLELRRWVEDEEPVNAKTQPAPNGRKPARGREAVMYLLKENPPEREWTISEVVRALADYGLAEPDDDHAVSVSLSRLFRAGKVYRPRKGVYTLTAPDYEDAPNESSKATDRNRLFHGSAVGEAASEGT